MAFSKSSSTGSSTSENANEDNDALIPVASDFKRDIKRAKQGDDNYVSSLSKKLIKRYSFYHGNIPFLLQDSLLNLTSVTPAFSMQALPMSS